MKNTLLCFVIVGILFSCNNKKDISTTDKTSSYSPTPEDTASNFFPVTTYLKGEIFSLKNGGITPLKKTTFQGKMDSAYINFDKIDKEFEPFLFPVIDTANLKNSFSEKKFLDQTLDAFTFTYDPKIIEDSFAFKHWDIYVDPESNKVKRIYLNKIDKDGKQLQLTWQSGKWCKIVTLKLEGSNTVIEKEEKISWSYDD